QWSGLAGEGPAIVKLATLEACGLVFFQGWIIDQVIRLGETITQVGVLINVSFHNTRDRATQCTMLGNQRQGAVLNLLQDVGLAVGDMNVDVLTLVINTGVVALGCKAFP